MDTRWTRGTQYVPIFRLELWADEESAMPKVTRHASHDTGSETLPRKQHSSDLSSDDDNDLKRSQDTSKAPEGAYNRLERRISSFDHQLALFLAECRQLGRSYALILATKDLREGLENLLAVFHENAFQLFPTLLDSQPPPNTIDTNQPFFFWLNGLADVCGTFCERLSEFREYTNESVKVKSLLLAFSDDLKYRSLCLQSYRDTLDTNYMRYYINDLADEMAKSLENLTSVFTFFNKYGMPAMRYEQQRDTEILFSVSTVATFFSAVTATTLQTSLSVPEGTLLGSLVNTFCLLAVLWKRTPYGSRGRRLPVWITVWIHASAPVFLSISIASFSAGLALFTYSSGQKRYTQIVTLVTTAITSFGVIIIGVWFGYEQYVAPLLLPDAPWRPFGSRIHEWTASASASEKSASHLVISDHRRRRTASLSDYSGGSASSSSLSFNFIPQKLAARLPVSEILSKVPGLRRDGNAIEEDDIEDGPAYSPISTEEGAARWRRSAKVISTLKTITKAFKQGTQGTDASAISAGTMPLSLTQTETASLKTSSLSQIPDRPSFTLPLPQGTIQDLEYSPNGESLAVTVSRNPVHKAVRVGIPQACQLGVTSILTTQRAGSSRGFLLAEKSTVFQMNISGHIQARHRFEGLLLRDVAVVPNTDLLTVAGRVMHSHDEHVPHNGRAEKQIILYDQRTRQLLSRHPVLDDVRHIRVARSLSKARNGFDVLISHKNKPAPRLWALRPQISGPHHLAPASTNLQSATGLAGHCHFIGMEDEMIVCLAQDGDVQIWDRETVQPVHRIAARAKGNGVRCFAWSSALSKFASIDDSAKELRIWLATHPDGGEIRNDSSMTGLAAVLGSSVTFDEPLTSIEVGPSL
ncbi:hypothetical protein H0H92_012916 [Tricholoma furcatifolium]|nr:hypothetical protein H0H92_012916 [Tricholoma furcatifolium]